MLLKTLDLLAVTTAWWLLLHPELAPRTSAVGTAGSLLLLGLLWLLAAEGAEAYPPEAYREHRPRAPIFLPGPALLSGALLLLVQGAVHLAVGSGFPSWPGVAAFLVALVLLPAALRAVATVFLRHPGRRPRVLIVGAGEAAREMAGLLLQEGGPTYELLGFLTELRRAERPEGDRSGVELADPQVLGSLSELDRVVAERTVDVLALARPSTSGDSDGGLAHCIERGIEVVPLAELVERVTGRIPLDHLGGDTSALPLSPPAVRRLDRAAKRGLDLVLVAIGLVFFLPAVPLIAAAIRLETPGPVFYTQERVGRGGQVFRMYKFRSMVADAEAGGTARWATEDDPRITRVGKILRGMHLDEFPQMLNILKGEMSPVGPRPERPEFVEELKTAIPHYRMRHAVRPGMAGWALVGHGYASSLEEAREKHEYDLYYVKHQSVWLDLVVLSRTLVDSFSLGGR